MFPLLSLGILFLLCGIAFPPLLLVGVILISMFVSRLRAAGQAEADAQSAKDHAKVAKARQQAHDKAVRFFQ